MPPVGTDLTAEFTEHAKIKNGNVPNLLRVQVVANPDGKLEPILRITIEKKIEVAEQYWWLNEGALWMMHKGYSGFAEVYDGNGQRLA